MKQLVLGLILFYCSNYANAFSWQNLWFTPDQQGQSFMDKKQYPQAQQVFERSDWSAAAAYKAGDYQSAADLFKAIKTEQGYYNYANSEAHLGKYEEALKAYEQALALNPNNKDAVFNRDLVKNLLKKDKQNNQNKKDQQKKDQQSKDQQNKDQQKKDQQNKDQQNKDQQNKDQQNKDQQNKDQQNKDQQNKDKQNKDKQNKDKQSKDQQNKDQQDKDKQHKDKKNKNQQSNKPSAADIEKQRAKEQWLRLIPDDPGGLMREKFLRDHLRRERGWNQ